MTRALYASYNGPLYQVQRASDNAIQDIGLLSIGGYANAAAQDSFCSGTTCYVTKIYDQTRNHNDLTKAARYLAQADAWPLTIAGHRAYGLKIIAGSGWGDNDAYGKHDFTTGVPTGAQPEGTYMVTSGSFTGGDCCFDYGNTEMAVGDHGQGHMDAISFSNYCFFPTCLGTGPWVGDDTEQGVFFSNSGSQTNPAYTGDTEAFVTGMIKNDGTSFWAIKSANAQSGGLTTWFFGALAPTVACCGYVPPPPPPPMQKEGGLTLGMGGDASSRSNGVFFEGAVVSGFPSDATDKAVQTNIVSARYSGRHRPRERGRQTLLDYSSPTNR